VTEISPIQQAHIQARQFALQLVIQDAVSRRASGQVADGSWDQQAEPLYEFLAKSIPEEPSPIILPGDSTEPQSPEEPA